LGQDHLGGVDVVGDRREGVFPPNITQTEQDALTEMLDTCPEA
jgi:hypothetical protein